MDYYESDELNSEQKMAPAGKRAGAARHPSMRMQGMAKRSADNGSHRAKRSSDGGSRRIKRSTNGGAPATGVVPYWARGRGARPAAPGTARRLLAARTR